MKQANFEHFKPFPLVTNGRLQTIVGHLLHLPRTLQSEQIKIPLGDGDQLSCELSFPKNWDSKTPIIFMIHGLGGSADSSYMRRITKKLLANKLAVVRINLRNAGSGFGLAKTPYHAGSSEDILPVLNAMKEKYPQTPFVILGFSLGANIALKLAGELKSKAKDYLKEVIAINTPVDIHETVKLFNKPECRIFEKRYVHYMYKTASLRYKIFPELGTLKIPKNLRFIEFDAIYTAPNGGFSSAFDYYEKASCKSVLKDIQIPAKMLFAADDPFVNYKSFQQHLANPNLDICITKHGGHLGFLSNPLSNPKSLRWLDHRILEWLI
jgi:uncharacterized protein